MLKDNNTVLSAKLSPQFQARLSALPAGAHVRALLLLGTDGAQSGSRPPRTRAERQATAQAVRATAESALPEIDAVLDDYRGKRLAERPTSLGTLLVETTSEGLYALATLERVKTIIEDQPIAALSAHPTAL